MRNTIRSAGAAVLALCSLTALALPASAAPESPVTGIVWSDNDFDGVRDRGEAGVPDITLTAYRADNTEAGKVVTDKAGKYALKLTGGPFILRPAQLMWHAVTRPNVGDDALDSDFDWGDRWETAPFSCAPGCPKLDLGLVTRKLDIGIDVTPTSALVNKDEVVSAVVTVSNKGTVSLKGDWFTVASVRGLPFVSAVGDGWVCGFNTDDKPPYLHCRNEGESFPGTSRPPVRVQLRPTAEHTDYKVHLNSAGFRRSETEFANNSAVLDIRTN